MEFVSRGDHAFEVFGALETHIRRAAPGLILGAGSIVDPYTASLYINVGANFVVGPALNPEIARICNRRKVPYSPGCGSASEISQAGECEWSVDPFGDKDLRLTCRGRFGRSNCRIRFGISSRRRDAVRK